VKFYDSIGPNPRLVRMFMLEKGITIPAEQVDIMGGANRRAPYTDKNPAGQLPALELDNGMVLGETVAICEYLEDKHANRSPTASASQKASRCSRTACARSPRRRPD
jgi:glutathione S-transferase